MGTSWSSKQPLTQIIVCGTESVGKSTICKSISLSYQPENQQQQYVNKHFTHDMIEQLRINCVKQMQWMLSHRYSYGYWETPSQDRSLDNDEMKSDTKFINDWRESYCFGHCMSIR